MNARAELSIGGFLVVFCLINYFYLIPTQVVAEGTSPVYPNLINTMLLCFSLAYLFEGFRVLRRERQQRDQGDGPSAKGLGVALRPIAMLVVTGVWVLSLEQVGFLVSTFLFLTISSRIFGSNSWLKTLGLSIIMPLVIYFIFYGLNSLLPEGPLEEMIRAMLKNSG